ARLAQSGHALDEHVAARERGDEQLLDDPLLAEDHARDTREDAAELVLEGLARAARYRSRRHVKPEYTCRWFRPPDQRVDSAHETGLRQGHAAPARRVHRAGLAQAAEPLPRPRDLLPQRHAAEPHAAVAP